MGGRPWAQDEIAIIVYFASRKVDHESCRRLLSHLAQSQRSAYAIRGKLDTVRDMDLGLWSQNAGWNVSAVDWWLLGLNVSNLTSILQIGLPELEMMSAVSDFARMLERQYLTSNTTLNAAKQTIFLGLIAAANHPPMGE